MNKKKILWVFLSVFSFINIVAAQNIDSVLTNLYEQQPTEKAYVQFDNNRYAAGETIWYKAYLISGFEPSLISRNFYIDWYDANGKLLSSNVTPIINGYSPGSFDPEPATSTGFSVS